VSARSVRLAAVWGLAAVSLAAQTPVTGTAAGLVLNVRARSDAGGTGAVTRVSGTAIGFGGSVQFRRFAIGLRYAEGTLQPGDAQSDRRDLVEGAIALKVAATPWLTFHVGPQIRSYTTEGSPDPERWVMWQVGGRGEAAIIGSSVRGHAMLWRGLGLDVNVPPFSGTAQGGEVGVTLDLPPRPFWFALAYGIDHGQLRGTARRETVETLTFTAGLRRR
jgi:hypothetical protein